jgi:glyoxylase-like metal-dependent hydrolase (beta-lactamase superfamily II)
VDRGAVELNALPGFLHPLGHGIHAVDTGFKRERFDAAYLLVHEGRAAFIDTGTNHAAPRLLASLDALGIARNAVDWIIPTHVHLDHGGGVGLLAQSLPAARVLVHPRGARHLADPTVLYESALSVYGQEEMDRSYGRLVPVDPARIVTSSDGQRIELAGRELLVADTPGHARHHHCIWDRTSRGWFTGDTFGISYREFDTAQGPWILATSTPTQFDPEPLKASIARLLAVDPVCMYLTHFGRLDDVPRQAVRLIGHLDRMVDFASKLRHVAGRHAALKEALRALYLSDLAAHGCSMGRQQIESLLAIDLELNAQGLGVWLDSL